MLDYEQYTNEWLTIKVCEVNHNVKFNEFLGQKCFTSSFLGQIGSVFGSDGSDEKQSDPQSDPRFFENFKN